MSYKKKMANKNKIPYAIVKSIYIGDFDTELVSTGNGSYQIVTPKSVLSVSNDGNINISGSTSVTIGGDINLTELPNRFIKPSGVSWGKVASRTEVFGVIPISIKGQRMYIPFINREV